MSTRSIEDYIQQASMNITWWLSDVELQFVASHLQIKIYTVLRKRIIRRNLLLRQKSAWN